LSQSDDFERINLWIGKVIMKLKNLPNEFKVAAKVIQEIKAQGFEAYFVGGSVRDALLNKPIHDVDIATSAYPEEVKQIFKRTIDIGIKHGTVLALVDDEQYEITTFRTESTYQDYRRPDNVTFVRSLKEDLKRRDFTINALALDDSGEIIDLFDGVADLSAKVIRAVGNPQERFHEDALRMMRGLRFASQLDFVIEPATLAAIKENHSLLGKIAVERITVEFTKLLLGQNRQAALQDFVATECYQYCPQLQEHGAAILNFSELPNQPIALETQAWALFVHRLRLAEHDIRPFLKAWKMSNQAINEISALVSGLHFRLDHEWTPMTLYKLGEQTALAVEELLVYFQRKSYPAAVQQAFKTLPLHSRQELAVTGNDIMAALQAKPGKWLGCLIDELEEAVVTGTVINQKDELLAFARQKRKDEH
jgi:tRNA nucleotidyltransferase (CCA-adding enzyme)